MDQTSLPRQRYKKHQQKMSRRGSACCVIGLWRDEVFYDRRCPLFIDGKRLARAL
jgi:hypothetical protein